MVCPADWDGPRCKKYLPPADYRIAKWLPLYYQYLMDELRDSGLAPDPGRIFLTAYPDPTYAKRGAADCDENGSADALEQIRTMLPGSISWDLRFTKDEINELRHHMIQPLSEAMEAAAKTHSWTMVNKFLGKIREHGLCEEFARGPKDPPLYPHISKGAWHPKSPNLEWAYDTSRERWFRNTNDSILFQFDDKEGPIKGSIKGSFHPDFRAHAEMADAVFEAVRARWRRGTGNLK
jgi:hypothetical protein